MKLLILPYMLAVYPLYVNNKGAKSNPPPIIRYNRRNK